MDYDMGLNRLETDSQKSKGTQVEHSQLLHASIVVIRHNIKENK